MNFDDIENLSREQITNLYENILETNFLSWYRTDWYCTVGCYCSDGNYFVAYGYQQEDRTYSDYYNGWFDVCNREPSYWISGGCSGEVIRSGRFYSCRRTVK